MKSKYILGISCYYHDAAAALIKDGQLIAAAQEERFTRKKHDDAFPKNAIAFCLTEAGIETKDLDYIVFYDKPILKFERIIQTYIRTWPRGLFSYLKALPLWMKQKLWIKQLIQKELKCACPILFTEHHYAHAASAFLVSPFDDAAVVTIDGVGEWETTTIGYGNGSDLRINKAIHFPDSLGLFYSALTYYLGFKVNSAEYKVMGLAPYGDPQKYEKEMRELIEIHNDGSFKLNQRYFEYEYGLRMINDNFEKLFGAPARKPESPLTQREKDIAASLQKTLEDVVLKIVDYAYATHPSENLCMAGGVALNCVANEKILKFSKFKNIFIQPAAGDAGGALGAAFYVWNAVLKNPRQFQMCHAFWGPSYSRDEIKNALEAEQLQYQELQAENVAGETARLIAGNNVVGWFQGRMEFGPRALGARSIVADARNKENWQRVNLKIKFRESFRPFAPTVLEDRSRDYFDLPCPSPYMLLTAQVKTKDIPAVTHVDNSARIQTISLEQNELYYKMIKEFEQMTGCPVIINTSFNVRGEPIVCSPKNAIDCFLNTDMDYLVVGNYLVAKSENRNLAKKGEQEQYLKRFQLD